MSVHPCHICGRPINTESSSYVIRFEPTRYTHDRCEAIHANEVRKEAQRAEEVSRAQ